MEEQLVAVGEGDRDYGCGWEGEEVGAETAAEVPGGGCGEGGECEGGLDGFDFGEGARWLGEGGGLWGSRHFLYGLRRRRLDVETEECPSIVYVRRAPLQHEQHAHKLQLLWSTRSR